jgi:dienelactone hydrolase
LLGKWPEQIFIAHTIPKEHSMLVERPVSYHCEGIEFEAYLVYDDQYTQPQPAVLVAHAWAGQGDFERQKARDLATMGYVGIAIDVYGKGIYGRGPEENAALMTPLIENRPGILLPRLQAALQSSGEQACVDSARVAAIGYCFGGLCVLDMARADLPLRGVASFHGLLSAPPGVTTSTPRPKILILHGHADPMATLDNVAEIATELTGAGADWQLHMYGHAMHSFTNPGANDPGFGTVYDSNADRRSWQSLAQFLSEVL